MKTSTKAQTPPFTSEDICAIIKQCGHSGVREFCLQGLKISFGPLAQAQAIEPIHVPQDIQLTADSQAREAIEKREIRLKQDLIDSLLVEDPEGFEELLKSGELVDEQEDE